MKMHLRESNLQNFSPRGPQPHLIKLETITLIGRSYNKKSPAHLNNKDFEKKNGQSTEYA